MKPEKQRIAIAEACGWRNTRDDAGGAITIGTLETRLSDGRILIQRDHCVPDYLNDLNAMHEAEKSIRKPGLALWCDYTRTLRRVCDFSLYSDIHASADQRAEAFLRTIGKWEDTAP